jgi:hypothetical protein
MLPELDEEVKKGSIKEHVRHVRFARTVERGPLVPSFAKEAKLGQPSVVIVPAKLGQPPVDLGSSGSYKIVYIVALTSSSADRPTSS